jgi:diacylglycerol kinase (ATP)
MPDAVVIRNPTSGRGRFARRWPELESRLREVFPDIEFWDTKRAGHATELASRASSQGATTVIAAGGDGTINQVANGIFGTNAKLGLLPCGTGNDLCRTLGIGVRTEGAIAILVGRRELAIDVGKWQTESSSGIFVNVSGMGFDSAVADRINRGYRSLHGAPAYLAAVAGTLAAYRAKSLRIQFDGREMHEDVMLAAIANARSYGGGMMISPRSKVADGLLDIVIVKSLGKLTFLSAFPKVFKGAHLGHPAVEHFQARHIRLEPSQPEPFLIDGELVPCSWVEIEVVPSSLRVLVPNPMGGTVCDTQPL